MKTVIDSMTVTPTKNVWNVFRNILKYEKCMSFKIGVELHLCYIYETCLTLTRLIFSNKSGRSSLSGEWDILPENVLQKEYFVKGDRNWDCVQDDLEWVSLQRLVEEWSQAEPWRRSRRRARSSWRSSTTSAACLDISSYTVINSSFYFWLRFEKFEER